MLNFVNSPNTSSYHQQQHIYFIEIHFLSHRLIRLAGTPDFSGNLLFPESMDFIEIIFLTIQ